MRAFDADATRDRRILILIPHPDDEVVGCCAALRRAASAGADLFAIYLTTGVPDKRVLWWWRQQRHAALVQARRAEALAVAREIGIEPIRFLEFASRTLTRRLRAAYDAVREAVGAHRIDQIWTPAWEGAHQDHDASNALAAQFMDDVTVLEFAEYNNAGGRTNSQRFGQPNGTEMLLELGAPERSFKHRMLSLYRSERSNLRHIAADFECLRPLPRHDYAAAPHPGTLFYERFQWRWLPFRHPRVDYSTPAAVRRRLIRNLKTLAGDQSATGA